MSGRLITGILTDHFSWRIATIVLVCLRLLPRLSFGAYYRLHNILEFLQSVHFSYGLILECILEMRDCFFYL